MARLLGDPENTMLIVLAYGTVAIELLPEVAPDSVAQVKTITRAGAYDNVAFHRVIDGFMAQTGDIQYGNLAAGYDPARVGTGGSSLPDVKLEASDISFDRGIVGMARATDPNSGNSQFFIVTDDSPFLDGNYTVFGEVIDGMKAVDQIKLGLGPNGAVLGTPDRMYEVLIADDLAPGNTSVGTKGRNFSRGDNDDEAFVMLGGNDVVRAGGGADLIIGGNGDDSLVSGTGKDTVSGGAGDDTLIGAKGNQSLSGGSGSDRIQAGKGNDTVIGGSGNDTLAGGGGRDDFIFNTADFGRDRIINGFSRERDDIDFRGSGLTLDDLIVRQNRDDTIIRVKGETDRIVIVDASDLVGAEDQFLIF